MHRRVIALTGVVGMLALTGCVPTSGPVAYSGPRSAYMDALLQGTIRITGDCVTVVAGDESYIPVFEVGGARYSDGVLVYGIEYRDGDDIQMGGGVAPQAGEGWYIPAGCPDIELWAAAPYLRPS